MLKHLFEVGIKFIPPIHRGSGGGTERKPVDDKLNRLLNILFLIGYLTYRLNNHNVFYHV